MALTNNQIQSIVNDIDFRIDRQDYSLGTVSGIQTTLDNYNNLISNYTEAIEALDAKIVSIGQSINLIKDEIVLLVSNAVGTSTDVYCGIASTDAVTGRCFISTDSGIDGGWTGGISTCFEGYALEYYDTVRATSWAFSSTSSNPYESVSPTILSNASNTFGVGFGTYLRVTQNNSSYQAGARVSLGASATCAAVQSIIDLKDAEIVTLRSGISTYVDAANVIRTERADLSWKKWNNERVLQSSTAEKDKLVGLRTAFTNPAFTDLYLNTP